MVPVSYVQAQYSGRHLGGKKFQMHLGSSQTARTWKIATDTVKSHLHLNEGLEYYQNACESNYFARKTVDPGYFSQCDYSHPLAPRIFQYSVWVVEQNAETNQIGFHSDIREWNGLRYTGTSHRHRCTPPRSYSCGEHTTFRVLCSLRKRTV